MTDQCIESAMRDPCDLGYLVPWSPMPAPPTRKQRSLLGIRGYCRQRSAEESLAEIAAFG